MKRFMFIVQVLVLYLSMTTEPAAEKIPVVTPLPAPDPGIVIDAPEPEDL